MGSKIFSRDQSFNSDKNFKCAENQLSARKTAATRLTFGIQRTKKIVRITWGTYFNARASHDNTVQQKH